jgi:polyphosphate glucokinase
MKPVRNAEDLKILAVDVGGTHVKCLVSDASVRRKFASGPALTPRQMVQRVLDITADWEFDAVSIGYSGVVIRGAPAAEPHHLASGWFGFDFEGAFKRQVRMVNDSAMQALGNYQAGKLLFLGLGTGLGSALIVDDHIVPMELGHLHQGKGRDYEDLLGIEGFKRLGKTKWRRKVYAVVQGFRDALLPDEIVVGGGQSAWLKKLPPQARRGDNAAAFLGGFRLWRGPEYRRSLQSPVPASSRRST